MKKILITIGLILICYLGYGQTYPVPINVANAPTQIGINNAFKGKIILTTFTDTTEANAEGYLKNYDGALIKTTSPIVAIWYRYLAAQQWVQLLPGGGSTGTLAWVMGGNNPVVSDGSGNAILGAQTNNGIALMTNNTQRIILPAAGLTFNQVVSDTTANKVMTFNPSTKEWGYGYWFGGGGAATTPTWQETLTAGSTLSTAAVIDMDGNEFTWSNSAGMKMQGAYLSVNATGSPISIVDSSFNAEQGIRIVRGVRFDGMLNATTQDRLIGQTSSSGTLGYITLSGLTLSSGVLTNPNPTPGANTALSNLASVAINTSLLPGTDNSIDLGSGSNQWRYGIFGTGGISIGAAAAPSIGRLQVETGGGANGGITLRNTTAGAYSTMDFYNNGGFNGQFLFTGSTYTNGFFNGNQLAFANYASGGNVGFVAGTASGYIKFGAGALTAAAEKMRINSTGVGIANSSPVALLTLGTAGTTLGSFSSAGNTSGVISFLPQAAAGTYNWNWPTTAGTSGYFLTSGGGGSTAMTWTNPATITGLAYIGINGSSNATGAITVDMSSGPYDFTISQANKITLDAGVGSDKKLFFLSQAISGASVGDALTVVDPGTGEIGVAPNLAFNFQKEKTMIYAKNGRLWAEDADKNLTQISPHNEKGEWIYKSIDKDGVTTEINMIRLAELLEKVTGEKLIYKTKN